MLRLQSDDRLISLVRRGNGTAFEVLVSRYHSRLLAFCRHLLGCKEDAEDVLQEVMAAAFNAMTADERPLNVRPWLYRIARNRCLNHLRRVHAVGVDSMDVHLSDFGASTADKVHMAEEFRMLIDDIQQLPESQRTALVLREMDALSYEQIAHAMETTVSSIKSLLVRARLALAEASEARLLSCDEVRIELAEVAEGLANKPGRAIRRHLRSCRRCRAFQTELKRTSKALAALLPVGPVALLKQLVLTHAGHCAAAGSGASKAGAGAALGCGTAAGGVVAGASSGGFFPIGVGALATKAATGLAAAALVTAGAVEVTDSGHGGHRRQVARPSDPMLMHLPTASPALVVRDLDAQLAAPRHQAQTEGAALFGSASATVTNAQASATTVGAALFGSASAAITNPPATTVGAAPFGSALATIAKVNASATSPPLPGNYDGNYNGTSNDTGPSGGALAVAAATTPRANQTQKSPAAPASDVSSTSASAPTAAPIVQVPSAPSVLPPPLPPTSLQQTIPSVPTRGGASDSTDQASRGTTSSLSDGQRSSGASTGSGASGPGTAAGSDGGTSGDSASGAGGFGSLAP